MRRIIFLSTDIKSPGNGQLSHLIVIVSPAESLSS
jgi:hypothetical protein